MKSLIVVLLCLPFTIFAQTTSKDSLTTVIKEKAKPVWAKAYSDINILRNEVKLAKENKIPKFGVVNEFNATVGKVMGKQSTFAGVDSRLTKAGDAYIDFVYNKKCARIAMEMAAESSYKDKQLKEEK